MVARRVAARVHRTSPRPGRRRRGCREATAAPDHPSAVPARQRWVDRRSDASPVRRRPRRTASPCSSPTATTRISGRPGRPTADDRVRLGAASRTGTSAPRTTSTRCRPTAESPSRSTATDGGCLAPVVVARRRAHRVPVLRGEFDEPRHGRVAVVDVASGARIVLTEDARSQRRAPYPAGSRRRSGTATGSSSPSRTPGACRSTRCRPTDRARQADRRRRRPDRVRPRRRRAGRTAPARRPASRRSFDRRTSADRRRRGVRRRGRARGAGAVHRGRRPTAPRCRRGSIRPPGFDPDASVPGRADRSTADRSRSTANGSSTSSRSTRARGTWCCSRTRAGPPGTTRSGAARSEVRSTGRPRLGLGRLRRPDGGHGRGDQALRVHRPERLAVMGGSYGGYMTSWIVGHTDRFRCAISERAVNDMASEDGSSDIGGFFRGTSAPTRGRRPRRTARISPLTYAAADHDTLADPALGGGPAVSDQPG